MKDRKRLIACFVMLMLILFSNTIFAASWTLVEVKDILVGFRFQYGNTIYAGQNYLATDSFILKNNETGETNRGYCIQERVLTQEGTVYNLTEYDLSTDILNTSISDYISAYAYNDAGNTAQNYYMNILNDKIRKSLNIAYMWERMYYPDDQTAIGAAQWFIWCQTMGWASQYMESYRENSNYPNGMGIQVENGYDYIDMNYGSFNTDNDNNGIFSAKGLYKPGNVHTMVDSNGNVTRRTSWDFDVAYATADKYIELVNYYKNFSDKAANLSKQTEVLFPGDSLTFTDSNSMVKPNVEWTLDTSNLPEGITAQVVNGGVKVDVSAGFQGYFKGTINLKRFEKNNTQKVGVYSNGQQQIIFHGALPIQSYDIEVEAASGKIRITKEDNETGAIAQGDATLVGAQYEVKKADGTYSTVLTIDENLQAETDWVGLGTYYVKEVVAPTGYNLSDTTYTVHVTAENVANVYIDQNVGEDVIKGSIKINKTLSATDYDPAINLQGAQFKVTLKSDPTKVYYSNISGKNGECLIENLPYGTYVVEEHITPSSALKVENFEVIVSENKKVYTYDVEDESKLAVLKIRKVDADRKDTDAPDYTQGDAKIEGAQYTLYRDENLTQAIDVITIDHKDDEGYWCGESKPTRTGIYYLKETKAAQGRLLDENVYVYELDNTTQTEHIIYPSKTSPELVMRGSVTVKKFDNNLDSSDERPSEGAILRLTLDSNPEKYYEVTLDENGYGEFVEEESREKYYPYTIPYGTYTITEVKASNAGEHTHFFINPEKIKITRDTQKEYRIFSDEPVEMYLQIEKLDKDTDSVVKLTGAKYKVWNCQTDSWVSQKIYPSGKYIDEFETNEDGILTLPDKIEAGEYIVYETKAPTGYYLDDECRIPTNESDVGVKGKGGKYIKIDKAAMGIEESATPDGQNLYYKVQIPNTPLKAKLEVIKKGEKLTDVTTSLTEYGEKYTPVYKYEGLEGVTYNIIAAEDIKSPDGQEVYVQKGTIVDTITTGQDGIATTKDLYLGEYEIEEIVTPIGYIKDDNIENVVLENENSLVKVETLNKELTNIRQKLNVTFEKEYKDVEYTNGENQEIWSIFGIYANQNIKNSEGTVVIAKDSLMDIIKIENDEISITSTIDLPEGKYYVKELDTSFPYTISEEIKEVTLSYVENNLEYVTAQLDKFINEYEKATVTLIKVSSSTLGNVILKGNELNVEEKDVILETMLEELKGKKEAEVIQYLKENDIKSVAGAEYSIFTDESCEMPLYKKDESTGTFVQAKLVTDESGLIKIGELPLGKYYLKETKAPYKYDLSEEVVEINLTLLDKDSTVYTALVNDGLVCNFITKTDIFTGEVVPNCKFEIKDEDGNLLLYSITNENGEAYIPMDIFEDGKTYTYTEIDAPEIYNLNTEPHEFVAEFDEEGNWISEPIAVENYRKESNVTLEKLDFADSKPIPNCKFELRSLETDFVVEGVTDENGIYVFENIPYGKYTYTELEAPEEYIIDTEPHEVDINAEEMKIQVTNEKAPETGDVQVITMASILVISVIGIIYVLNTKKELIK